MKTENGITIAKEPDPESVAYTQEVQARRLQRATAILAGAAQRERARRDRYRAMSAAMRPSQRAALRDQQPDHHL